MPEKSTILRCCLFVVLAAALLLVLLAVGSWRAEGKTITVDDDGEGEYEKIQWAIENATEDDEIRVWDGTYDEDVVVDKRIDLIGNGSETTTINGSGNGDAASITADWVNMCGFSVTGASGLRDTGILVESDHNTISNNNCPNNGYGIYLTSSLGNTITNNTCSENNYYGIYLNSSLGNTITNNTCSENNDYGIFLDSSRDCTIESNTCSGNNIHGISLWHSSGCTITNNTCSENNRNGIDIGYSSGCTITNNTCSEKNENGIYLLDSWTCTITNNTCSLNNKGIYLTDSSGCTITKSTIFENVVGINLDGDSSSNSAQHNKIYNNSEYGINATGSDYSINAVNNWWGTISGPHHPEKNPGGTGDNITEKVKFDPWMEEWSEEEPEEAEVQKAEEGLSPWIYLLFILVLATVLKLLIDYSRKVKATEAENLIVEKAAALSPPQQINSCPHCHGEFETATMKRPIKFNCHFCRKEIEFK